ncbi:MAG: threonine/serine exporter family protein [Chloroflexota bacterium]|nr:threonine/serine exporter family protein [Chloroflexota bacterium]
MTTDALKRMTPIDDNDNFPDAVKPPLDRDSLRDVIDLALWAGQLMLAHGADTARIEETTHRVGTALGATWMDILVSPNAVVITTTSGEEFRTKVRRVVALGVNMAILDAVNALSRRIESGEWDRVAVRRELERIGAMRHDYPRWLIAAAVGAACAGFSRLFGGDGGAFAVTFAAAGIAMLVRQALQHRHFNALIAIIPTAFTAGMIAASGVHFGMTATPEPALAASVLLLVPGVHLINAMRDLLMGHIVTGLVRGVTGALISVCIAIGMLLALGALGIQGF